MHAGGKKMVLSLDYNELSKLINTTNRLGDELNQYCDDLNNKVQDRLYQVEGGMSSSLNSADYFVKVKIVQIRDKENNTRVLTNQLQNLLDTGKSVDLDVERVIQNNQRAFLQKNPDIKPSNYTLAMHSFWAGLINIPIYGELLEDASDVRIMIRKELHYWWECNGGKVYANDKMITNGYVKTENIENKKNGVLGIGLSASVHLMGGGTAGKTIYIDRNGNIAIMKSGALTATTDVELSAGANVELSLTANDVRQMEGWSVVGGVGGDVPGISPGGNYEYAMSAGTGEITSHSLGLNMNLGFSPAEVHGGMSKNDLISRFNYKNLEGEYHGSFFGKGYSIRFDFKNGKFQFD